MKIKNYKKDVLVKEEYKIDYENGIVCYVKLNNGDVEHYRFYNRDMGLELVDDINNIINNHWSVHHKFLITGLCESELKNFNDFDKLFYIGSHSDGTTKDRHGNLIGSLLILDDTFCSIWGEIGTPEVVDEVYDKLKDHKWVKKIDKIELPYYNSSDDRTHTVRIEFIPDSEILNDFFIKRKSKFIDDGVKLDLLNYMLK